MVARLTGAFVLVAVIGICLAGHMLLTRQVTADEPVAPQAATTPIALPDGMTPTDVVIDPSGAHVAYLTGVKGQQRVVVDGTPGDVVGTIRTPWTVLGEGCIPDMCPGIFFSADGTRMAYAVAVGAQWAMVIDGKQVETAYDDVDIPIFSPDGKHVAYAAKSGGQWRVIADGVAGQPFAFIGTGGGLRADATTMRPMYSGDSAHLLYVGKEKPDPALEQYTERLVVDGQAGTAYARISDLHFTRDAKHVAYIASDGKKASVVRDGQKVVTFPMISDLALSADGTRLAYAASMHGESWFAVDGEKRGEDYEQVRQLCFSADGRRLAYVATRNKRFTLVVDGTAGPWFANIVSPAFSPGGRMVVYQALTGAKDTDPYHLVQNGRVANDVTDGLPAVFSPDGDHLAYVTSSKGKSAVVRDGKPGTPVDGDINDLHFSPDGAHLIYRVNLPEPPQTVLAIDGKAGRPYDRILSVHLTSTGVRYYAITGGKLYRVDEPFPG